MSAVNGTFEEAMELTLGHEGGYYDGSDPRDPNPTMYGVTQKRYDEYRTSMKRELRSVQLIAPDELQGVYRDYWYGTCDRIAKPCPRLALCLFDMAINGGVGTARKLFQRALDCAEDGHVGEIDDDGVLGPKTWDHFHSWFDLHTKTERVDEELCMWILLERVRYYSEAAAVPRLRPNLASWISRTVDFYNKYIRT